MEKPFNEYETQELIKRVDKLEEHANQRNEMLVRIDERTRQLVDVIASFQNNFIRREEFDPVKKVVYGLVATILIAVAAFLLKFTN